jgi:hypothetical protein
MLSFIDILTVIQFLVMLFGVILSIRIWLKIRGAKSNAVKLEKKKGGVVIVLQITHHRMIPEAVQRNFPDTTIELVDALKEVGTYNLISKHHYEKLAKAVYFKMVEYQSQHIHLVLSGPVGLNCIIGQLIGLNYFSVEVHQFDAEQSKYIDLPIADKSWQEQISLV